MKQNNAIRKVVSPLKKMNINLLLFKLRVKRAINPDIMISGIKTI